MRCPVCGGKASHIITDMAGDNYYRCMTGLTRLGRRVDERSQEASNIVPCDTILDSGGRKFTGLISYFTDGNPEVLKVVDGKDKEGR